MQLKERHEGRQHRRGDSSEHPARATAAERQKGHGGGGAGDHVQQEIVERREA